jgi:tetratricopeptide (TPR) repeat protein
MSATERLSSVGVWEETVVIPTYRVPPADRNPMFLDKRVYQGSSGKVYPNPFTDRVSDEKVDQPYQAIFLENEYIRLMILPEIGGRIHVGQDKTNGYDFFYRQQVIKPALVGLLGPWISGGVEFNWPQHHRPSTFMPVDRCIEEHEDGSRTVWLSEHEPMNRMKGMVGICLRPGKALIEAKVRLYNRTPFVQTFLWWANVGVHAHQQYQAFFPPDVHFVADHARRAVTSYPIARDFYYGVDYRRGVDISWYKNIPVPTSYMVPASKYDFFGGYDHAKQAGLVHVADHHIAPGKKLWTWGNAEFGHAWDRELTDADGPYIELMAGVYTDNQPDFSFLHPYETRTFSQYWYPIQKIGPAKNANRLMAVSFEVNGRSATAGVSPSEGLNGLQLVVTADDRTLMQRQFDAAPGAPYIGTFDLPEGVAERDLLLRVLSRDGRELIRYRAEETGDGKMMDPATEPPPAPEIASSDELYLTGLHLEQYRHATRRPEDYWEEALRRDPYDARCNNAAGLVYLRRGQFAESERFLRRAIARQTQRNPNPYDGEPHYNLGVALKYMGRLDEAYDAFYKAVWNYAWRAAGYYALATIDCRRGDFETALQHLALSLVTNADSLKARGLMAAALRRLGRAPEALQLARETAALDRLDFWARHELALLSGKTEDKDQFFALMRLEPQTCLDLAFDYADAGLWEEALDLIEQFTRRAGNSPAHPMVLYAAGYFAAALGDRLSALEYCKRAAAAPADYCFPARLEEMLVLEHAMRADPSDARAPYYLGNLLYDKWRREEAIQLWERACRLDPSFSIPWRNLGLACFNVRHDPARALACYEKAFEVNPSDARLLYELDQLRKRAGHDPQSRLAALERRLDLVAQRDDLSVELATLYNQTGQSEKALGVISARRFHPWEGGEGLVSGQYVRAHLMMGRSRLESGDAAAALQHFEAARVYPENLGEGKHLLTLETHLDYFTGMALKELGRQEEAVAAFRRAAEADAVATPMAFYRALALRELGHEREATIVLQHMRDEAERRMQAEVKIDYFATSLPNFLLFEDDLAKRQQVECAWMKGLAHLGLGSRDEAMAAFEEAARLDTNHIDAQEELRRLRQKNQAMLQ